MLLGVVNIVRSVMNEKSMASVTEFDVKRVVQNLFTDYASVFKGVGVLKDYQVKLHIDDNVVPVH